MNDDVNIFELYVENAKQQKSPTMFVDDKGTKRWKLHGKLHREDGPAIEYANGNRSWWKHGHLHREDGPAIEHANGDKSWYMHHSLHRIDGPAVVLADGDKEWCVNGKYHRLDGPAVDRADGSKEWWVQGEFYSNINAWAAAALEYEGKEPTEELIEQKIAQAMQQDLFD